MWDGGLKEFIIFSRNLGYDTISHGSSAFSRAEEVWTGTFDKERNIKNLFYALKKTHKRDEVFLISAVPLCLVKIHSHSLVS